MNNQSKQLYGNIATACIIGIVLIASKIIPMGMSGQIGNAKLYIAIAVLLFLIGIPCAVLHQYHLNLEKEPDDPELRQMRYQFALLTKVRYRRPDLISPNIAKSIKLNKKDK